MTCKFCKTFPSMVGNSDLIKGFQERNPQNPQWDVRSCLSASTLEHLRILRLSFDIFFCCNGRFWFHSYSLTRWNGVYYFNIVNGWPLLASVSSLSPFLFKKFDNFYCWYFLAAMVLIVCRAQFCLLKWSPGRPNFNVCDQNLNLVASIIEVGAENIQKAYSICNWKFKTKRLYIIIYTVINKLIMVFVFVLTGWSLETVVVS
jgi:hypothetical protein